jgi:hypothetical protein
MEHYLRTIEDTIAEHGKDVRVVVVCGFPFFLLHKIFSICKGKYGEQVRFFRCEGAFTRAAHVHEGFREIKKLDFDISTIFKYNGGPV